MEFVDRKTASKCLERMKDGYRLDGNSIKVAWATNKGINKDRQIKSYWNVEVGCTYVPWADLDSMTSIDFIKWAEGGLIDEDSIPEKLISLFRKQMLQLANSDSERKKESESNKSQVHDMELDEQDEHLVNQANVQSINSTIPQQIHLPPPPLPPISLMQSMPSHLLNSDILNHLRTNQPPPTGQIDPLNHNQTQMQFLPGLPPVSQQAQMQDIQSAIAHFQQMNSQNQFAIFAIFD